MKRNGILTRLRRVVQVQVQVQVTGHLWQRWRQGGLVGMAATVQEWGLPPDVLSPL